MISLKIPAHNEKENLVNLLPLLQEMISGVAIEVLVALSGDTNDGSEQITSKGAVYFVQCEGRGRALQMNMAAKKAMGNILVFLHADVIPPQSFFKDICKTIIQGYDAGFFSYSFDKDSFLLKINARFTAKDGIFTGGGDQCLFIKKKVFHTLGGFD